MTAMTQKHDSAAAVAQRIKEWLGKYGKENTASMLLYEATRALEGVASAQPEPCHPDDAAVDRFADAMKQKLAQAREKGRGGWQQCDPVELSIMLREHVEKGDPRDVANFCMFLWSLGKPISDAVLPYGQRAAQRQAEAEVDERAALAHWLGCWEAAEVEGLQDALNDAKSVRSPAAERLADLIERRIAHGVAPARAALAAQSREVAGMAAGAPEWETVRDHLAIFLSGASGKPSSTWHDLLDQVFGSGPLGKVRAMLTAAPTQQEAGHA